MNENEAEERNIYRLQLALKETCDLLNHIHGELDCGWSPELSRIRIKIEKCLAKKLNT